MSTRARLFILALVVAAFSAVAAAHWNDDPKIRRATAIIVATLILWISELAPLGVVALLIPIAATASGILEWKAAVATWGDDIVFLFLGAFLLARALDKHGAFDWLLRRSVGSTRSREPLTAAIGIMLLAGLISTVQNNTAVTALLLPATVAIARSTHLPALPLLALSYGATFGGMATPVGTAPNFIGYSAISKFSSSFSFVYWMRVGVPVWLGATVIAWGVITLLARFAGRWPVRIGSWFESGGLDDVGPALEPHKNAVEEPTEKCADGRLAAWTMFALAASVWLTVGICKSALGDGHPIVHWLNRYVPDSLVPVAAAAVLFVWRAGPRMRPVLDRHDFQSLDWDTLFLIAGGLCLGKTLEQSGAAAALAAGVAALKVSPLLVMLALGGVTVLLSELTSNTATAQLMVPLAASIAPAVGLSPLKTIWLVALSASMGFALPISTPPNAIVYGTRLVPLRLMIVAGLAIDVLGLAWVVACIHWLG